MSTAKRPAAIQVGTDRECQQTRMIRRLDRAVDRLIAEYITGDPNRVKEVKQWALEDEDAETTDG